jgi:hypothetical protein
MPLFLLPPPRRIRITRRNFTPATPALLFVDPRIAPQAKVAVARLAALFPGMQPAAGPDPVPAIRLVARDAASGLSPLPDLPDLSASEEAYGLEVSEEGILLAAVGATGFRYGADLIGQLFDDGEVVGVRVEDWPVIATRELTLPGPAADLTPGYHERLLVNVAWCRFNRLSFAAGEADADLRQRAAAFGIALAGTGDPTAAHQLPEPGSAGPPAREALAGLRDAADAARAAGEESWRVRIDAPAAGTPLDNFWFALAYAGACGWNPAKVELRAYRRAFATRFYGSGTEGAQEAIDALAEPATVEGIPIEELFAEDPASPHAFRRLARGAEAIRETSHRLERAAASLASTRERAARNPEALAALEGPLQRLITQCAALLAAQQARESYADAWTAASSPRAVSRRIVQAAETLETSARRIEPLQALLTELRAAERRSALPEATWAPYRERIEWLRAKGQELRALRDTYIQTGSLPEPAGIGLAGTAGPDTAARHPGRAAAPVRLPPRHSPEWWPEGGEARIRIEVGREGPLLIPWEIAVDLRAWAGQEGAFHVGRARLVPYDDEGGDVGAPIPFQLTRGGFAALLVGRRTYYLYLDRRGATGHEEHTSVSEAGPRVRSRQSAAAITVEGALGRARVERVWGLLDDWSAPDGETPALSIASAMGETPEARASAARVRVLENGPLLVRIQAEDEGSRVRQYDVYAGQPGWEWAASTPAVRVENRLRPEAWADAVALFPAEADGPLPSEASTVPLAGAERTGAWAARLRPDGLALAAICPEGPARHFLDQDRHDVEAAGGLTRLAWCLLRSEATPHAPESLARRLEILLEALRRPPRVSLGPVEERRSREF